MPMYCPWLWVIPADHFQHTMGTILVCLPPLCSTHLPIHDGPDTQPLLLCNRNHRWCHCPWQGWWRTWWMPPQTEWLMNMALYSMVENVLSDNHLWPSLDVSVSKTGHTLTLLRWVQGTTCIPTDTNTAPEVPQHGHILITIHVLIFLSINCSRRAQTSHGMNKTRKLLTL